MKGLGDIPVTSDGKTELGLALTPKKVKLNQVTGTGCRSLNDVL